MKPSRRASFEVNKKIGRAISNLAKNGSVLEENIPSVVSAALQDRLEESDTASISDGSSY